MSDGRQDKRKVDYLLAAHIIAADPVKKPKVIFFSALKFNPIRRRKG